MERDEVIQVGRLRGIEKFEGEIENFIFDTFIYFNLLVAIVVVALVVVATHSLTQGVYDVSFELIVELIL